MTAEDLGKRSLAEVQEVGLDEILDSLRLEDDARVDHFGLPAFDRLVQSISRARTTTAKSESSMPIIELMSLYPGNGKTHLLYYLTAIAILPTYLSGKQTTVVILDTHCKFSTLRLAQQIKAIAGPHFNSENERLSLGDMVVESLKHVHIFHPQSIRSTIATLHSLQDYLFNASKHYSFDRSVGFIALDSAATFYWQVKAEAEDAALTAATSKTKPTPQPSGYVQLAAIVKSCSRAFRCPVLFTTAHLGPMKKTNSFGEDARSFRPSLPPPWQTLPTVRLVLQRTPVRKLPADVSIEEALRESELRQSVVEQGKFECFINEWGMNERMLQQVQEKGSGFDFVINRDGFSIQKGLA